MGGAVAVTVRDWDAGDSQDDSLDQWLIMVVSSTPLF